MVNCEKTGGNSCAEDDEQAPNERENAMALAVAPVSVSVKVSAEWTVCVCVMRNGRTGQ